MFFRQLNLLFLMGIVCLRPQVQASEPVYFYEPQDIGSQSLFNPLSSFLSYTLDSVQIKRSFGTRDYSDNIAIVEENLKHPGHRIEEDGGKRFINAEVIPVDLDNLSDSKAMLPNYGLHLFGGGMLYRKNAEWFAAHDMPFPYFTSAVLSMVTEILAEGIEKPTTDSTDEIADVYLFRPLGIWLFSDDKRARWIKENLDPVDWPHLMMYDVRADELLNAGISYVIRPRWFAGENTRLFGYLGISNLFGLSHRLASGDDFSWGVGVSTESIEPTQLRASAGFFYDRNNSLLGSLILGGTESLALRANVYPGVLLNDSIALPFPLGLFFGITDHGDPALGLQFGLPIGLGASFQ